MDLHAGTLQDLLLPQDGWQRFEVRVVLDGQPYTLALAPFSVRSPGFVVLVTDHTGTHPVPAPPEATYAGTVLGMPGSSVAATLRAGQLEAHIRVPDGGWTIQPLTSVSPAAARSQHVVYRIRDVVATGVSCGADHHEGERAPPGGGVSPAAIQICELALDCDQPYYLRNGSDVNATVQAATGVIYAVSSIYQTDVEIRYLITAVVVRTTPVYVTGPDLGCGAVPGLLQEFRDRWIANHGGIQRDTAHLFSGAGSFAGTVGCAYIGVICSSAGGYGASRAISSNAATNVALVAHELGHNWSATHCDASPPCNIMCSGIGGCSGVGNSFSAGERAQILAHKATRTCLSTPARSDPNPNVFYRLTTLFQGPSVALDVINDGTNNNRMIMTTAGAYTGQYWRFTPAPEIPGTYRISCLWRGQSLPMDIINGGPEDNQPILAPIGPYTGQLWTLTEVPQAPGYVALHTEFRGPNLALEGFAGATGNRPVLASFGPYSGQVWLLTPLISVDPASATPFGSACRGRGGVPQLQATNGTAPWIGENMTGEVTNVLSGTFSELILGAQLPTPIDLGFLNSPGCLLRVSLTVQVLNQVGGGRATFTLPIPANVGLVGLTLPIQASVIDPARGPGDPFIAMTNGLDLRMGLR